MKKHLRNTIIIFLMSILFPVLFGGGSAFAEYTRDDLTRLQISRVAELRWPSGGTYLEGGTATSSGYLTTYLQASGSEGNPLRMLDMNTWEVKATAYAALNHANDMCYIPQRREIYVVPMGKKQIIVLDEDTLQQKDVIKTKRKYHAIGYDTAKNCFAAIYKDTSGDSKKSVCDILDGTCQKVLNSFTFESNLTYQGLGIHNSLIYYSCWEKGQGGTIYQTVYDGILKKNDNLIYVFDYKGNLVNLLLVEKPEGFLKFEVETVTFSGDRMFLQFNETYDNKSNSVRIGIYEVVGEGKAPNVINEEVKLRSSIDAQYLKMTGQQSKIRAVAKEKKSIRLRWKAQTVFGTPVGGYEVQICHKKSFKGKTLQSVRTTDIRHAFGRLKRKTTYYLRVRAYMEIGGKEVYSRWSQNRKVRTK